MKESFEYAESLINNARNKFEAANKEINKTLPNCSNIIAQYQMAIELSGKAIFKIMGLEYPKNHQLLYEKERIKIKKEVKELLGKDFPKYFNKDEIPRVLFLTYFWGNFRTLAQYGIEELNFPPDKLFTKEDAELARKHAEKCINIANDLLIFKRMGEERR